jgi:hypothetical protein
MTRQDDARWRITEHQNIPENSVDFYGRVIEYDPKSTTRLADPDDRSVFIEIPSDKITTVTAPQENPEDDLEIVDISSLRAEMVATLWVDPSAKMAWYTRPLRFLAGYIVPTTAPAPPSIGEPREGLLEAAAGPPPHGYRCRRPHSQGGQPP